MRLFECVIQANTFHIPTFLCKDIRSSRTKKEKRNDSRFSPTNDTGRFFFTGDWVCLIEVAERIFLIIKKKHVSLHD